MENACVWGPIPQPLPANLQGRCIWRRLPTESGIWDSLTYAERPPTPSLAKPMNRVNKGKKGCCFLQALHCHLLGTCCDTATSLNLQQEEQRPRGCAGQPEQCRGDCIANASAWFCASSNLSPRQTQAFLLQHVLYQTSWRCDRTVSMQHPQTDPEHALR